MYYLHQGGYGFIPVGLYCWLVCMIVSKNNKTDFDKTWLKDVEWVREEPTKCWCGSGSEDRLRITFFFHCQIVHFSTLNYTSM